jgi:protein SCO1/2
VLRGFVLRTSLSVLLLSVPGVRIASAQMTGAPAAGYLASPGASADTMPAALREIGFDQKLDQPLPLDTEFVDDAGARVRIGKYFGAKPVVLAFVYYECPMLCTQVMSSITGTLGVLPLDAGRDFELVLVSFDPRETPAQAASRKREFLERYKRPGAEAGWHFLTGDEASIKRLTQAAGFRYTWDEATQQFAHPAGIIIVTPDGRPARYLFGLDYGPRDVEFALVEASQGKVGSIAAQILLFCYHYDPMSGRYGFYVMRALRIAGVATVLAIVSFIFLMVRGEKGPSTAAPRTSNRERRTSHLEPRT